MTDVTDMPDNPNVEIRVLNPEGAKGKGRFGWHFWPDAAEADDATEQR
ncbi:hypothetical protein ACGF07_05115 [Kitasatospora sp. NPDC048194]